MSTTDFAKAMQRMLAITDTGLTYTKDPFDRERYEDLRQILWSVLQDQTELNQEELTAILKPTASYATPLMDVRAWIVQDQKICLVRGQGEDTWALPGGFGEVGYSPKENIQKEVQEETGFSVEVGSLLAIFDTNRFQLQNNQYVKFVFDCQLLDGRFQENQEVAELAQLASQMFPIGHVYYFKKTADEDQFEAMLKQVKESLGANDQILLKGSNSMNLAKLVESLENEHN